MLIGDRQGEKWGRKGRSVSAGFRFMGTTSCLCKGMFCLPLPCLVSSPFLKLSVFCVAIFRGRGFPQMSTSCWQRGPEFVGSSLCQRIKPTSWQASLLSHWVPAAHVCRPLWEPLPPGKVSHTCLKATWLSGISGAGPALCLVPEFSPVPAQLLQASTQVGERVYRHTAPVQTFYQSSPFCASLGFLRRSGVFLMASPLYIAFRFLWLAKWVITTYVRSLYNFVHLIYLLLSPLPLFTMSFQLCYSVSGVWVGIRSQCLCSIWHV